MTMEEDINVDEPTLNPAKEFTYLTRTLNGRMHVVEYKSFIWCIFQTGDNSDTFFVIL